MLNCKKKLYATSQVFDFSIQQEIKQKISVTAKNFNGTANNNKIELVTI